MDNAQLGDIAWLDLTVDDAEGVRDFYQAVIGWEYDEVSMGEYSDFAMKTADSGKTVSGVCHARGPNADLPPMWLPYFLVADVDSAANTVLAKGGELITEVKSMGSDKFVIVKDPAGAACALYQKG